MRDEGSRDEDRTCECDLDAGYYDYDYREDMATGASPEECVLKECRAGTELHKDGMPLS